ncbi:hypothetical protein J1N35_036193 [Gossypium stocksii]|uniref:F-box domain-containing protein n=1 Tax=Gossypium stocksii TaxID=47602 RepID=A0A9D3ZKG7_9ROSI|nr:hypothetical protein J1N35_036193 [Gossypium stocksii]
MLSKKKTIADVSGWANLLDDLLAHIASLTRSPRHHIRMTAVCRSWRASLADQKINFPAVCLMLREGGNCDNYNFYSISEEIFDELDLPELRGRRYWEVLLVGWYHMASIAKFNCLTHSPEVAFPFLKIARL